MMRVEAMEWELLDKKKGYKVGLLRRVFFHSFLGLLPKLGRKDLGGDYLETLNLLLCEIRNKGYCRLLGYNNIKILKYER